MKDNVETGVPGPGSSEKKQKMRPAVPPRRNISPDPLRTNKAQDKNSCVSSEEKINRSLKGILGGGDSTPTAITFSPRAVSSSASSLCSSTSQLEESSCDLEERERVGRGSDKPSVSFDPNPTILLTGSDGSPLKTAGKDGPRKMFVDRPDCHPQSALKKTNDENVVATHEAAARMKPDMPEDCYLKELYAQVSSLVNAKPDERPNINEDEAEFPAAVPMIWISKWVDYSDKYGLGYQLSDDSIGVLFNDFTKLLLLPDGDNIHYIERNGQEHYHQLSDYPLELNKKVTLLRYFRNYMNEHLLKAAASMSPRDGDELARIPSLKTYFRTRSAIILHLTNGTLQINFFDDHTKLILCPLMSAVTYIDTRRNFRTFKLSLLEEHGCSSDLGNRLRYARNMIQKLMLTKSSSSRGSSTSAAQQSQTQPQQQQQQT